MKNGRPPQVCEDGTQECVRHTRTARQRSRCAAWLT
jgi:hypothetical protein